MARILGVDIPDNKQIRTSLTYIYGIGDTIANKILIEAGIDPMKKTKDLSDQDLAKIRSVGAKYKTEGDLRREVAYNIKRLKEIGSYVGVRHRKQLPVRGQRTKTNARTVKGPRKTVANKKAASKG